MGNAESHDDHAGPAPLARPGGGNAALANGLMSLPSDSLGQATSTDDEMMSPEVRAKRVLSISLDGHASPARRPTSMQPGKSSRVGLVEDVSTEIVSVTLVRDPREGFGLNFIGPHDEKSPQTGIFVTSVKPQGPAALCGKIYRGQRIIGINGMDTTFSTKDEAVLMVRDQEDLALDLRYDAHGYAVYDSGEELRRLGLLLWERQFGKEPQSPPRKVKYIGATRITVPTAENLQMAYKAVSKLKRTRKMAMTLTPSAVVCLPTESEPSPESAVVHVLLDVVSSQASGETLVIVCNDTRGSTRTIYSHFYSCRSAKDGCAIVEQISHNCERGFTHVRTAMRSMGSQARLAWANADTRRSVISHDGSAGAGGATSTDEDAHPATAVAPAGAVAAAVAVENGTSAVAAATISPSATASSAAVSPAASTLPAASRVVAGKSAVVVGPKDHKLTPDELARARSSSMSIQERNRRRATVTAAGAPKAAVAPADVLAQPWYRDAVLSAEDVRAELGGKPLGSFIVCPRNIADSFSLHVCEIGKIRTINLEPELAADDSVGYRLLNSKAYPSLLQLINHHGRNPYGTDNTGCPLFLQTQTITTYSLGPSASNTLTRLAGAAAAMPPPSSVPSSVRSSASRDPAAAPKRSNLETMFAPPHQPATSSNAANAGANTIVTGTVVTHSDSASVNSIGAFEIVPPVQIRIEGEPGDTVSPSGDTRPGSSRSFRSDLDPDAEAARIADELESLVAAETSKMHHAAAAAAAASALPSSSQPPSHEDSQSAAELARLAHELEEREDAMAAAAAASKELAEREKLAASQAQAEAHARQRQEEEHQEQEQQRQQEQARARSREREQAAAEEDMAEQQRRAAQAELERTQQVQARLAQEEADRKAREAREAEAKRHEQEEWQQRVREERARREKEEKEQEERAEAEARRQRAAEAEERKSKAKEEREKKDVEAREQEAKAERERLEKERKDQDTVSALPSSSDRRGSIDSQGSDGFNRARLPSLRRIADIAKSERERQLEELDETETAKRLSEMTFSFSFG